MRNLRNYKATICIFFILMANLFWLDFIQEAFKTKTVSQFNYNNSVVVVKNIKTSPIKIKYFDKYITLRYYGDGQFGNQIFKFASLYAIGQNLNRSIFFHNPPNLYKGQDKELNKTFPNYFNHVPHLTMDAKNTKEINFGQRCCRHYDVTTFHNVNENFLMLNATYLQSYKYFNDRKKEILYLFDFNKVIKETTEKEGKKLFKKDIAHKLCVHIRRDGFVESRFLESREDFVVASINFVYNNLTQNNIKPISLVFFGTDFEFIRKLKYDRKKFVGIYQPKIKSRAYDMYFAIKFCDSFIISASGSTFAWWIAYLLPEGTPIYYNSQVSKKRDHDKDFYDYDYFPFEWNMLELNSGTNSVTLDNRWLYERYNVDETLNFTITN